MKTDYTKQLYLYDDRNKYDYLLKVNEIIFEDEDIILCKAIIIGPSEYGSEAEQEKLLINKKTNEVVNNDYYSWRATSDDQWVTTKIEDLIARLEE